VKGAIRKTKVATPDMFSKSIGVLQQGKLEYHGPVARKTDPESSFRAGEDLRRSGEASRQLDIVLAAVKEYPGHTSKCIAMMTGIDRYIMARRLPELATLGKVIKEVRGSQDCTWSPVL
jgi:hypothetical protein